MVLVIVIIVIHLKVVLRSVLKVSVCCIQRQSLCNVPCWEWNRRQSQRAVHSCPCEEIQTTGVEYHPPACNRLYQASLLGGSTSAHLLLMLCITAVLGVCSDPDVNSDFVSTGYPGFQTATYTSRSYAGITPGYTYQFPGNHSTLSAPDTLWHVSVTLTEK